MNKNVAFYSMAGDDKENIRSQGVVKAIRNIEDDDYRARVLRPGECRPATSASRIVTIFDMDCVGALWFPRLRTDGNIPLWAASLSTGPCVGICNSCCDACVAKAARDIVKFFTKDLICGVNKADIVDEHLRETIFTGGDTRRRDFELRIYGSSRN